MNSGKATTGPFSGFISRSGLFLTDRPETGQRQDREFVGNSRDQRSASFIEKYKSANPDAYEKQLIEFKKQNMTLPKEPRNLDFEDQ